MIVIIIIVSFVFNVNWLLQWDGSRERITNSKNVCVSVYEGLEKTDQPTNKQSKNWVKVSMLTHSMEMKSILVGTVEKLIVNGKCLWRC